ncbi:MAG: hypothetical protein JOZ69_03920 [Myxococcales bacterium]|nr:hypothetical protein [Myxococcales bacterium]
MSDDKPSALRDVRQGLGLLFRAARTAASRMPKGGVEEVVKTSAREVGRAFENVASTIERGVFGKATRFGSGKAAEPEPEEPHDGESAAAPRAGQDKPKPPDGA